MKNNQMNGLTFGNRLVVLRKNLHLNQEEFAEKIGVGTSTIHRWEHDITSPNQEHTARIAQVAGVTVDALLGIASEDAVAMTMPEYMQYLLDLMPEMANVQILVPQKEACVL